MDTPRDTLPPSVKIRRSRTRRDRGFAASSGSSETSQVTTTLTARFGNKEREIIDKAAALKKWSPAQLLREAAVRYAADIVNAEGWNGLQLQRISALLRERLVNPELISEFRDTSEEAEVVRAEFRAALRRGDVDPEERIPEDDTVSRVAPLNRELLNQLLEALTNCPTQFASLLKAQLASTETLSDFDKFRAVVDASQLLSGEEETEK